MKRTSKLFSIILAGILVIICLAPTVQAAEDASIKVSIMVIGDSRHAAGEHSQYQVWMDRTTYSVADGARAVDLIFMALKAKGMKYENPSPIPGTEYITSITAPSILGGYPLSDGYSGNNGNGPNAGWMVSTNKPGYHELLSVGIGQYNLSNGEFLVVHYVDDYNDIDWENPRLPASWLSAASLPQGGSGEGGGGGSGSGGSGGGGDGGTYTPGASITQIGSALPKEYTSSDFKKLIGTNTYQLTVEKNSVIKAGALTSLPKDAILYADMKADNRVQFRIKFPSPSSIDIDLKAGMGFVPETNSIKQLFSDHYKNKLQVLAFDHTASWGQTVEIMIYAENVDGFDSSTWKLYSYDTEKNLYTELSYQVDKNQYIRFSTDKVNPVVFSDGMLLKK